MTAPLRQRDRSSWGRTAIRRMIGTKSEIVFRELSEDDPKQRKPDIAKARAVLGWELWVPLEEGLRETVAYFRGLAATVA